MCKNKDNKEAIIIASLLFKNTSYTHKKASVTCKSKPKTNILRYTFLYHNRFNGVHCITTIQKDMPKLYKSFGTDAFKSTQNTCIALASARANPATLVQSFDVYKATKAKMPNKKVHLFYE